MAPANIELNQEITRFGKDVLEEIRKGRPSIFKKDFWAGQMMMWAMTRPEIKTSLFRLVDVLPALKDNAAIAAHTKEYLGSTFSGLSPVLSWCLRAKPRSLRGQLAAQAVKRSIMQMAALFIAGENPKFALSKLKRLHSNGLAFTVDLLGEFSVSERESMVYLERYLEALNTIGTAVSDWQSESTPLIADHPGERSTCNVSVKLTALYSQCSPLNFERSVGVLRERLTHLAEVARSQNSIINVDAEDSGNNPIIYETFKRVFGCGLLRALPYPGIVIQAYAKNSRQILNDLLQFAKRRGAPIAVRLVKGAYWDYETVLAEQQGWPSPLFAHKESTDNNFEELSKVLLDNTDLILPAIASHNVRSLAHACCYAEAKGLSAKDFELQMLYGMAEPIAEAFSKRGYLVRLYVPLGNMIVGMGYLVRRLLENSSNESFLKHAFYDAKSIEALLNEPQMLDRI